MPITEQTRSQTDAAARAAATSADAQALAAEKAAQQLQQQIQIATDKAIQEALKGGKISKDELRDQIRIAIDASRDAMQAGVPQPPSPPGWTSSSGDPDGGSIPPQVPEILGIMGFTLVCCVVGFPLARAVARWIDRRGNAPPAPSREVMQRLQNIEQAVESVAVEVERISEGQRFTTRVLSERTHEPAPDFVAARDPVPVGTPANARRS